MIITYKQNSLGIISKTFFGGESHVKLHPLNFDAYQEGREAGLNNIKMCQNPYKNYKKDKKIYYAYCSWLKGYKSVI